MRGNPECLDADAVHRRSIPACAGEPQRRARGCGDREVYPRVCGGTIPILVPHLLQKGLSPRVRGNRALYDQYNADTGSIPACAGEPLYPHLRGSAQRVYPRVCGGTRADGNDFNVTEGLSPRVRGNRKRPNTLVLGNGSIPACAGEPSSMFRSASVKLVYPRVCGGTESGPFFAPPNEGLSPRVRGNRPACRRGETTIGSIPACAGEPYLLKFRRGLFKVYPRVCGGTPRAIF